MPRKTRKQKAAVMMVAVTAVPQMIEVELKPGLTEKAAALEAKRQASILIANDFDKWLRATRMPEKGEAP